MFLNRNGRKERVVSRLKKSWEGKMIRNKLGWSRNK